MKPRRIAVMSGVLVPLVMATMLGCVPFYGANFRYPADLPLPDTAKAVLSDEGWDDDDPIRTRLQVVDADDASGTSLTEFYRQTLPSSEGWKEVAPEQGEQLLCMVNETASRYTEVVEVFNYTGDRVEARSRRFVVMISRIEEPDGWPCGLALDWIAMDLY